MPETLFLHIETRGAPAPRVLPLPVGSVRVGRGKQCEVRLGEPSLADIECVLRLRGETWYVQPLGNPGHVSIDGRPIQHLRILAPGVPLKVGEHQLTLRPTSAAVGGLGSFEVPIPVGPAPGPRSSGVGNDPSRLGERSYDDPIRTAASRAQEVADAVREVSRGDGITRERWTRDAGDGRMWEARWRAAASNLRSRMPSPPIGPLPAEEIAPDRERPPATVPFRPAIDGGSSRAKTDRVAAKLASTPEREPDCGPADFATVLRMATAPSSPEAVVSATTEAPGFEAGDVAQATANLRPAGEDDAALVPIAAGTDSIRDEQPPPLPVPSRTTDAPKRARRQRDPASSERPREAQEAPDLPEADDLEWPSARVILASVRRSPGRSADRRAEPPRPSRCPSPTESREPGHWSPSLRLAWLPAAVMSMACAAIGLHLAWGWGEDAREAGAIADRMLRPGGPGPEGAADAVATTDASWWRTTSGHLALKAAALGTATKRDPAREEEVAFLLDAARKASPLEPASRLARARRGGEAGEELALLGMSRDTVGLALTARRLARAGKTEAALRAYRSALELAAGAEIPRGRAPAYLLDGQAPRRFALPNEELIAGVVREMASQSDWTYERWSAALPDHGLVLLATHRVLRERQAPEADAALDRLVASAATGGGGPDILQAAARAEGLALREKYAEAAALYGEAIAAMDDDTVRRTWWLNLAEILSKGGDQDKIADALTAARAGRGDDAIGRRVGQVMARESIGGPPATVSRGLRAN